MRSAELALGLQLAEANSKAALVLDVKSEEEVLRRCQGGDWSEYGLIVERYQRLVWAAVDAVTACKADLPDLVQEVFIRAFEKLPLYHFRSSFASWLYRVARNHALDAQRRRQRQLARDRAGQEESRAQGGEAAGDPLRGYLSEAREQALRLWLARLPSHYHEALVLHYFQQLSYEEVAQALGLPLNTVRTHLRRARLQLAELAQQSGWTEE